MDELIAGQVDPPQEPLKGSTNWIATGPEPLIQDERLAVLMVRVGMVANALTTQVRGVRLAKRLPSAARMQHVICSLIASAALTFEAMRLAQEGMRDLRSLAHEAGAPQPLMDEIGLLCGGKHPAQPILDRARNNLGFHWDQATVAASVREYRRNRALIWIENTDEGMAVHRLAVDVLAHALIAAAGNEMNVEKSQELATGSLGLISGAMDTIIEFFTAASYGYMKRVGGERFERSVKD
jgi:hypothetical protein